MMSKKAFISLPIAGNTQVEILTARSNAREYLKRRGYATVDIVDDVFYEIVSSKNRLAKNGVLHPELYLIAIGLKEMSMCEIAYFCDGWLSDRNCQIAHVAAAAYGLKIIYEEKEKTND